MGLETRLLAALEQAGRQVDLSPELISAGAVSVTLAGSLARGDFRLGGSDVDLLVVHDHPGLTPAEAAREAALRRLVRHFSEPLQRLAATTQAGLTLVMDCHLVGAGALADQPRWADPATARPDLTGHDRLLWLYAFDLQAHHRTLWGPDPTVGLRIVSPQAYLPAAVAEARRRLEELSNLPAGLSEEQVPPWKALAGEIMALLALQAGCPTLRKRDLHRYFNACAPYFKGKDFAASLWAEYLYGTVFQARADWLARCRQFCTSALTVLEG